MFRTREAYGGAPPTPMNTHTQKAVSEMNTSRARHHSIRRFIAGIIH